MGTLQVGTKSYFVVDIFAMPEKIDTSLIHSASEFIILTHLNRPLIKLNANSKIEGDLCDEWRVEDDFKKFTFHVREDAQWSDGTKLTSQDVVATIQRQMSLNSANHFNFKEILKVSNIGGNKFIVQLKSKNLSFIRHVTYPEFGVLHKSQISKEVGKLDHAITSGPYVLEKHENGRYYLSKNKFYKNSEEGSPSHVVFQSTDIETQLNGLNSGKIDFAIPHRLLSRSQHNSVVESKKLSISSPHIGYTFWVSINPKSKSLSDVKTRHWIQKVLDSSKLSLEKEAPFWQHAKQLYLPDGLGRPKQEDIDSIWSEINSNAVKPQGSLKLKVLVGSDFPLRNQFLDLLKKNNIEIVVTEYSSPDEMFKKLKSEEFDLFQVRNDFSSEDLHENLQTTFNPSSFLMLTDSKDNQFQSDLVKALSSSSDEDRHNIYSNIGRKVLRKGYIAPLLYQKVIFYYQKNLDISKLSVLYPELSIWKISPKK